MKNGHDVFRDQSSIMRRQCTLLWLLWFVVACSEGGGVVAPGGTQNWDGSADHGAAADFGTGDAAIADGESDLETATTTSIGGGESASDASIPTTTSTAATTETQTASATVTETDVPTATVTEAGTESVTSTQTVSATATETDVPTATGTEADTDVVTSTETVSATATETDVPTATVTESGTDVVTSTQTASATATETDVPTATTTESGTDVVTSTQTLSALATETDARTATTTEAGTDVVSSTQTAVATATETDVPTATTTESGTDAVTSTQTVSATATETDVPTATGTEAGTDAVTSTQTAVATATETDVPTATTTESGTDVVTSTQTVSATATETDVPTATTTESGTDAVTSTQTVSATATETDVDTSTEAGTDVVTSTETVSATATEADVATTTDTEAGTDVVTSTETVSATAAETDVATAASTEADTDAVTSTETVSATAAETDVATAASTEADTDAVTSTETVSATATETDVDTSTEAGTDAVTSTETVSATATATEIDAATTTDTEADTDAVTSTETVSATAAETDVATAASTEADTDAVTSTQTVSATATETDVDTSTEAGTDAVTSTETVSTTATDIDAATTTDTEADTDAVTSTETVSATDTDVATVTGTEAGTDVLTSTETVSATATETDASTSTVIDTDTLTLTSTEVSSGNGTETSTGTSIGDDASDLPEFCDNDILDAEEVEVDCGGPCLPCVVLEECVTSEDCGAGVCIASRCVSSTCDDGILDGDETEVDCGGSCGQCEQDGCATDLDCAEGTCVSGQCEQPVCGNEVTDHGEECDDGNPYRFDGCLPDCRRASPDFCVGACSEQGTRMVPSGELLSRLSHEMPGAGDSFGVALTYSNDHVFVGAPYADKGNGATGTVSVFQKTGTDLLPLETLGPRDTVTEDGFGAGLVADRNTLLVGAPFTNVDGVISGAVYVFKRRGENSWVQSQLLEPSDPVDGLEFGLRSLAIDGDVLAVGVPNDSEAGFGAGAVYLFNRDADGRFVEFQKIASPQQVAQQHFGYSVSLRGSELLVGAPALDSSPSGYGRAKGHAYRFSFDGATWALTQTLTSSGPSTLDGYNFGWSVVLDEQEAFVSAPREDFTGAQSGVLYAYRRGLDGYLTENQKFGVPETSSGSLLGMSLTLHNDLLLAGQPFRRGETGLANAGGVVVFQRLVDDRFRYSGLWTSTTEVRNGFYGTQTIALDDVAVISNQGDRNGEGSVALVALREPLCDLNGLCICEPGADGDSCDRLTQCGDGVIQPSEECDVAISTVACESDCTRPNCSDGRQNGNESDVDCGGGCGATCTYRDACVADSDCLSRKCGFNFRCQAPSCSDRVQNGDESDKDCGMACPGQLCGLNKYCYDGQDCESGICGADGRCEPTRRIDGATLTEPEAFGASIAVDGNRLIVGAPQNAQVLRDVGAAYIFSQEPSGVWVAEEMLFPVEPDEDVRFGLSVDIEGDLVVVGAPGTDLPTSAGNQGAAFVYVDMDGQWMPLQALVATSDSSSREFGTSVCIADGLIIVGAEEGLGGREESTKYAGSVHVYAYSETLQQYEEVAKLYDPEGEAFDKFGSVLAVDGMHMAVGAKGDSFGCGAVSLYESEVDNNGSLRWQLKAKIACSDQPLIVAPDKPAFGASVDISGDKLAIGAPQTLEEDEEVGAVYLYEYHSSGSWLFQTRIFAPSPYALSAFGHSVRFAGGDLFVSDRPSTDLNRESAVFRFSKAPNGTWRFIERLNAPQTYPDSAFGAALSSNAETLIVGAPESSPGSVYFFEIGETAAGP